MYYRMELKDHIRVPPRFFSENIEEAVLKSVREKYDGFIDPDMGLLIDVTKVISVNDGMIIPGDGAAYYETTFEALVFKPELQEVAMGKVRDIADFGAFLTMGPIDGMIHVSQTMNDFVSFSKEKVLTGKESGRVLHVGDICKARVIAVSFKDPTNPKIGLTMRQQGLGKPEWSEEEKQKVVAATAPAVEKKNKRPVKGK